MCTIIYIYIAGKAIADELGAVDVAMVNWRRPLNSGLTSRT